MTGSSEMDNNKQTEESNNIPNNVGKSESSDSIEVIIHNDMFLFKKDKNLKKFIFKIQEHKFIIFSI